MSLSGIRVPQSRAGNATSYLRIDLALPFNLEPVVGLAAQPALVRSRGPHVVKLDRIHSRASIWVPGADDRLPLRHFVFLHSGPAGARRGRPLPDPRAVPGALPFSSGHMGNTLDRAHG